MSKGEMVRSLPICDGDLKVRPWVRQDAELLAAWPSYPAAYAHLNLAYRIMSPTERETRFISRDADLARVNLVADLPDESAVAYLALVEINWTKGCIGNMCFRVKPTRCDQGLGTRILRLVMQWCLEQGMNRLRLDVAAANLRAIRCYEKAGFVVTGEFWREDAWLRGVDLSRPEYDLRRLHVRQDGPVPQTLSLWMEVACGDRAREANA